ncbi:MAG TPA: hypothetical protein PK185_17355 [Cyclobacteriaceae bacterium]|nr:hypothetical protein [Cyclobacteriaceae bacterium]
MKQKLILITLHLVFASTYSQSIIIELSIKWETDLVSLDLAPVNGIDELVAIPYLIVKYKNTKEYPVYLRALFDLDDEYPLLPYESNFGNRTDLAKGLERLSDYSSEDFNVYSLSTRYYNGMCEIIPKESGKNLTTVSVINYDISRIHLVLKTQALLDKFNTNKRLSCFDIPGKETILYHQADSILNLLGNNSEQKLEFSMNDFLNTGPLMDDRFVFLKPRETQIQKVNLIGFYIAGGNYKFCFEGNVPRYVLGDSYYDNNAEKWRYKRLKLPAELKGHKLISGRIQINCAELSINRE